VLLLFEGGAWRWPTVRIGYKRQVLPGVYLKTIARQPSLFEVTIVPEESGEELSMPMVHNIKTLAEKTMEPSMTEGKYDAKMRSSTQTFLPYTTENGLSQLRTATSKLLRAPEERLEHLQVLRYELNQHYDAHLDPWDPALFPDVPRFSNADGNWHQRMATLFWYLAAPDEGGNTWFPRAHGGDLPRGEWSACDERGELISPKNATAALFYSLRADGYVDMYSWHAGCPVKAGTKWACNSWLRNSNVRPSRKASGKQEL